MTQAEHIQDMTERGFHEIYVWDAKPGEEDPEHKHDFDTRLVILAGHMDLGRNGGTEIMTEGSVLEIPRGQRHSGKVGAVGCKYIVGERH
jgi:quercetin dioxygenase-like cupin family protein